MRFQKRNSGISIEKIRIVLKLHILNWPLSPEMPRYYEDKQAIRREFCHNLVSDDTYWNHYQIQRLCQHWWRAGVSGALLMGAGRSSLQGKSAGKCWVLGWTDSDVASSWSLWSACCLSSRSINKLMDCRCHTVSCFLSFLRSLLKRGHQCKLCEAT